MNDYLSERRTVVLALLAGALGIAMLWAGGVDFPPVPPGMVILVVGAVVVARFRARWSAWLGCALGVFIVVGFLLAGINGDGFDHLLGHDGGFVVVGQVIEVLGAALAAISGVALARSSDAT